MLLNRCSRGVSTRGSGVAGVELERNRAAVGDAQRGFEALGKALLHIGAYTQPIDDDIDVVLLVLFQLRQLGRLDHRAVDAKAHEALRQHVLEQLGEFALALAHHRREDHQARALGQREHRVDHLADALRLQRKVMIGAIRCSGARIQQAQVVVDLGDGAHRRARIVRGGLLLDADRRAQAFDHVDVGLVHQLQELPRVGRQALDIAALPFGIQRVEGKTRLARTRQPRDHDQPLARYVDVDVLQVVGAGTTHADRGRVG